MAAAWRRAFSLHRLLFTQQSVVVNLEWQQVSSRGYSRSRWMAPFDAGQPTHESHPELLSAQEIFPGISVSDFAQRRKALKSYLPTESMVILGSATVKQMTEVVPYPFRQDADYLYFTGCQQPEGLAVLDDQTELCMFMPEHDTETEAWAGHAAGTEEAIRVFGADCSYPLQLLSEILPQFIARAKAIYCDLGFLNPIVQELPQFQEAIQQGKVRSLNKYSQLVRWVKSSAELELMRQAAAITSKAMLQSMKVSRVYRHEHLLAATVEYECKIRGAQRMAFPSVVGGGTNGSIVHYCRNDKPIDEKSLVLMDVGCEFHGYVSDMTRTWPPCGTFSPTQREVYEVVLDVMKECFKMCKPGVTLSQIHQHSVILLWQGLVQLGLAQGNFDILHFYEFNRTQVGHYLGMDVHDCSTVSLDLPLKPGVVITIEPGLYIPVKPGIPERFQGMGIRIEDEVLITRSGHEVLTASVPKEIAEIEAWLGQSKSNDSTPLRTFVCEKPTES
ncbi:hypothetical protein BDL97_11G104400 [Sphagnum fallax]|nr:hypothetical protein BDL97_11G104400 [Sphagnum fallax]